MSKILFIPVYNCKIQIKRLIEKIKNKNLDSLNEILFVDNRSSDGTLETIVEETTYIKKKITIIQNDYNYGLGGSHKVALNYALNNNYKDLIVFHGDDQGNVDDLEMIISKDIDRNFEFILGSRFMRKSILNNYSFIRIAGNIFFNFIFSVVTFKKLSDLGSGLNLIRLDNLDIKQIESFPNNLTFNYNLILYICYFKKKFLFVPITWSETDQISNVKYLRHVFQMCSIILNYMISKKNFFKKTDNKYTWKEIKN
ncbi:glycosyltransferase family 2 protein [Candidatus Pelagibacter sp.]|nr:glycosyltransferase family 2 protein [Candidatus Pelagibacter sp.]